MEIKTDFNDAEKVAVFKISGRINTATAPDFENALSPYYEKSNKLVLDLEAVEHISSAGLRVLMNAEAALRPHNGVVVLKNIGGSVREVLDMTGIIDFLTVE